MLVRSAMYGVLAGIVVVLSASIYLYSSKPEAQQTHSTPEIADKPEKTEKPKPIELPFGGRELLPNHRFIALYGNPDYPTLGALGEQNMEETLKRLTSLTGQYQSLIIEKAIPTFEVIATIASAEPTQNNDYSREVDIENLKKLVKTAKENEIYVVLDLQPGRSSFDSQAVLYEELLLEPHVGLAIDPEWRLQTQHDRHLKKVGSVSADEINRTSVWLADLVKKHDLPQKLLIIHQFKLSMITKREVLDTSRPELAYILHMDGHGQLGSKVNTWNNIKENLPKNLHLGWKNFHDEDKPTPTPEQTMQQTPKPYFISYQ